VKPRIALATYEAAPSLAPDDQLLVPALARAGVDAEPAVWSDDAVIWETFDGVVIRSCWDYHRRVAEFVSWLERLDASRLPVWNPVPLVQWNANKRYLLDLEARGVGALATRIVPRGAVHEIDAAFAEAGTSRVVIKPAVSASGYETHAFSTPLSVDDREIVERIVNAGDVLVQPFAEEIPRDGELSFTFIDGSFSHAAIKRATGDEFRVQTEHGGSVAPIAGDPRLIEQAARALTVLPEIPLYARVDGIDRGGAFLLMELELIEPNLFLGLGAGAADRFATALARRLRDA
jgi:glutathione synthase/RimK-type ligase-like ATP-grasp enzyme